MRKQLQQLNTKPGIINTLATTINDWFNTGKVDPQKIQSKVSQSHNNNPISHRLATDIHGENITRMGNTSRSNKN